MMLMHFAVDEDDESAINEAITEYQRSDFAAFGELLLPEGESDMRGAIIAEICRNWMEYRNWAATLGKDKP